MVASVGLAPATGQTAEANAAAPAKSDDIVVVGRRLPQVKQEDVRDTIPAGTIKAYAADSIGELLDRLSARFPRGFSILVNGRRLASVDAINALPPEALERIELLKPGATGKYGLGSSTAVVNLALRPRFQATSLDADGSGTTEGGGDAENGAVRYSRIRTDKRLNVALTFNRQSGLLESDRDGSGGADPAGALHSLVPRQNVATLTTGFAAPIGALNLDLSAELGAVRSVILTGPLVGSTPQTFDLSTQRDDTRYFRSGVTLSGTVKPFFWSVLVNGELSHTTITNERGGPSAITAAEIEQGGALDALPNNNRAINRSIGATATISGPLLTLPAGALTLDASASVRASDLTSIVDRPGQDRTTNPYKTISTHAGINVPIVRRNAGRLGRLGDFSLRGGIDYLRLTALGGAVGTSSALDWSPAPSLLISARHDVVPSLPSGSQRYAPIVALPGVLVYDAATGEITPVTVLTGGRADVRKSRSANSTVLMSYQTQTALANVTGSLSYTIGRIRNPLLSFSTPSPLAQALLPGLFVRGPDGSLLQFDARPFNGLNEMTRQLSAGLHLSGPGLKKTAAPDPQGGITLGAPPPHNALTWDANLSYAYTLSHRLRLLGDGGELNLLTTPLSLTGPGSARHHIGLQWTVAKTAFGLNGSIAWDSGARVRAINSTGEGVTRYSAVTKVNIEGFVELDRSKDEANPRSLRLKAGIDNLLNRRLRITGYPGLDARSQQFLIDPYGRVFRISVRKMF